MLDELAWEARGPVVMNLPIHVDPAAVTIRRTVPDEHVELDALDAPLGETLGVIGDASARSLGARTTARITARDGERVLHRNGRRRALADARSREACELESRLIDQHRAKQRGLRRVERVGPGFLVECSFSQAKSAGSDVVRFLPRVLVPHDECVVRIDGKIEPRSEAREFLRREDRFVYRLREELANMLLPHDPAGA